MIDLTKPARRLLVSTLVAVGVLCGCAAPEPAPRAQPAEVTVRCPVSDTDTVKRDAESSEHGGKVYYFCCAGCKEAFERNPERYTNP